ncbi:hypothetical protein RSOLAG1IB_11676 [Rhizoctonia solani AG-1 IB]|uniref:Uncharacterized protein n=1 Tax=Thanatephorus cucumeris (strain AG1-IB / isolate 7/3/14) TaxID=1108050 RepID=M5C4N2_THACB|nr:hypothetical protein BN14_08474 [Rhizoctonia solani AG-1 IB]CEL54429.1 hypothetical protein RSOLAG1IB_11676 [Rhizoctonia solani AG-1 IB]
MLPTTSVCCLPLCTSSCTQNPQGCFTTLDPAHPYAQVEPSSRPASWNSNQDPSVGGILQEAHPGAQVGDQGAMLESIQQLVILLSSQVANLSQQIRDRDQEFQDLQALVKETNQTVTKPGLATPEVKPAGTDVHQTPRAFGLWDSKPNPALATAATINPIGTSQQTLPSFALPTSQTKPPPSSHLAASS